MSRALEPYYGGDHRRHAERIFSTHISGGRDRLGFFSFEQKMFIAEVRGIFAGMLHIVGKRQNTYKISPLIVVEQFRQRADVGTVLLRHAEEYARRSGARQLYCTVAKENAAALTFFLRSGFVAAGESSSHYKSQVTEVMLYKGLSPIEGDDEHISVMPFETADEAGVRQLLLDALPSRFSGIDDSWVTSLFDGYKRRSTRDINSKYKLIFVATNSRGAVRGVAGATPKKGSPIKLMPVVAQGPAVFEALPVDVPYLLKQYGHKLYVHVVPTVDETIILQKLGWHRHLDGAMPGAYSDTTVTQQWSLDLEQVMRTIRVKRRFYELIVSGRKTLEVRVAYDNIKTIRPGEPLRLVTREREVHVLVKDVRNYRSFDEMLAVEPAARIAPDDPDGLPQLLRDIYPPAKESLGVVVLELSPQP